MARLLLARTVQAGILEMWILGGALGLWTGRGHLAPGSVAGSAEPLCWPPAHMSLRVPSPPQISLFVGAWWQMGYYTTVATPFPC